MNNEIEKIEENLKKISFLIVPDKSRLFSIFDEIKNNELAELNHSIKNEGREISKVEGLLKKAQDFITSISPAWRYTFAFGVILIFAIPITINKLTTSSVYISKNTSTIFDIGSSSETSQDDLKILDGLNIPNDIYKDATN